jgi:hypothetical protein
MVQVDRAYIPVIYYLEQGDVHSAKRALFCLERQWKKFSRNYAEVYQDDDWSEGFRKIGDWIEGGKLAIRKKDIQLASAQIENLKYEMMCLRESKGLSSYFDYLWKFEETLFMIEDMVNDPKINLYEWNEMEGFVNELNKHWVFFEKQQYDPVRLLIIEVNEKEVIESQALMTKTLIDFTKVLLSADRIKLQKAAMRLRPVYFKVLHAYGDFETTKIYYADKGI